MNSTSSRTKLGWPWFLGWLAVGSGYCLAFLGAFTIGIWALCAAVLATVLLILQRPRPSSLLGLLSGVGLPVLVVAYLNRSGPGTVCTRTSTGEACIEQYNPWFLVAVGLVLVAAGAGGYVWVRRGRR